MEILTEIINNSFLKNEVNLVWEKLGQDFILADNELLSKFMDRRELSFHDQVKLLGFLSKSISHLDGNIVEIGVWKGKSLAFIERMVEKNCKIIGIDPCEIPGQRDELYYFKNKLFPKCDLIINYSHVAMENLLKMTKKIKLLHIDGGHQAINVWLDFLIYNQFLTPGGYIVFDDYSDLQFSPEVKQAVDTINSMGLFEKFDVIGTLKEFPNSFVLRKK